MNRGDFLMIVWRLLVGSLDFLGLYFFMKRAYGEVVHRERIWNSVAILFLFGVPANLLGMNVGWNIVLALPLLRLFRRNPKKKLLVSVTILMTAYYWSSFIEKMFLQASESYFIILESVICHGGFWGLLLLAGLFVEDRNNEEQVSNRICFSLLLLPFAGFIGDTYVYLVTPWDVVEYYEELVYGVIEPTLLVIVILSNILVLYVYGQVERQREIIRHNVLLGNQVVTQAKHYEELEAVQREIRGIRHDLKNHMNALFHLLEQGKIQEAEKLLEGFRGEIAQTEKVICTGNVELDTVLNVKVTQARHKGIPVEIDVVIPSQVSLAYEQAVTIFGNLFDNAIEANEKLPKEQRSIILKLRYVNMALYIQMNNSCAKEGGGDDLFGTTKGDAVNHGLGLQNVRRCVTGLGGFMEISRKHRRFYTKIILYYMKQKKPDENENSLSTDKK